MEPLERAAALSEDGKLFLRVARLYLDSYEWAAAESAASSAIERGGLDDVGSAWLVRGMAMARLEQFVTARRHFEQALASDKSAGYAHQWLTYIEREQQKLDMLALEQSDAAY